MANNGLKSVPMMFTTNSHFYIEASGLIIAHGMRHLSIMAGGGGLAWPFCDSYKTRMAGAMWDILESLNPQQKQAAKHIDGALLILAGAGSGKTKTITTRLAYLLSQVGIPPQHTLTLTFTNKAASEMQARAMALIAKTGLQTNTPPILCTFHSFGLMFLQKYFPVIDRPTNFSVIDERDRNKIVRDIAKSYAKRGGVPRASALLNFITESKNNNLMAHETYRDSRPNDEERLKMAIYGQYQEFLVSRNLVDFDDLIMLPCRILRQDHELRKKISSKYQYITVDEYQDVNDLQNSLLDCLCETHSNLCVVGDDDQSIYGWRGANVENILNFPDRFEDVAVIKLEQNYRSTKKILDSANMLIAHNTKRHEKILVAQRDEGEEVEVIASFDEKEEMQKIIARIQQLRERGADYKDIAILFRINQLSNHIELCLLQSKIPYQIVGGTRFDERQEIKDVLAYLRLAFNPHDDFSLFRIINNPRRGFGDASLKSIEDGAMGFHSVYAAMTSGRYDESKYLDRLVGFFTTIKTLRDRIENNLSGLHGFFANEIGLYAEKGVSKAVAEANEKRQENIREFFNHLESRHADLSSHKSNSEILKDFIDNMMLVSLDTSPANKSRVLCMTIHNSKGLEFNHVFVVGLEDGVLPMQMGSDVEEERRLAYVAFTRARNNLTLSYVKERRSHNIFDATDPSRFLMESGVSKASDFEKFGFSWLDECEAEDELEFATGDCVQHKILGFGRIEAIEGSDLSAKAIVDFGGNRKTIFLSFLTKI